MGRRHERSTFSFFVLGPEIDSSLSPSFPSAPRMQEESEKDLGRLNILLEDFLSLIKAREAV